MIFVVSKILLLAFVSLCYESASGSRVAFSASSSLIQPLLTSAFSLRCALEDTASSSNIIGRSLASTASNAKFVTSIFIYKNGIDLATVSEHIPAQALSQNTTFDVSGSIPGPNGEKGFIELKWVYPEATDGGSYQCEIGAIDEVGHQIKYSQTADVDVVTPSLAEVVHHVITEDKINKAEISRNQAQIANLLSGAKVQSSKIANNTAEIDQLKIEVNNLKTQLAEAKHIEHGVIHCYNNGALNQGETATKSATFKTPYNSVPEVFTSVKEMDVDKNSHAWFDVSLVSTTTKGFTISCKALDDSHGVNTHIGHLEIAWLSLP